MAKQLKIKVLPEIEENALEKELQKAIDLADKMLDFTQEIELHLNSIDDSELQKLSDQLDDIAAKPIEPTFDAQKFEQEIGAIADEFDQVKKGAQDAFDQAAKAAKKLAAEGKDNTAEYEEAIRLLKERKTALDKIADAEKSVGDAIEVSNDALDFIALKEAAGSLSETFGAIVEKGDAFKEASKQLQAQTGATGAELDKLKSQAREAFVNGVGESAADAIKVIGQAKQTVGKFFEGDELTGFITAANSAGKAFDKDVNEVLQKSQGFIQAFNTSGEVTGDLLTLALRDGKVAADDILDTIQEFPTNMKDAGVNAQEFIGLLLRGKDAGYFNTNQIANAVKETQLRLNSGDLENGLASLANVPKDLLTEINNIAKSAKQGEISVKDLMFKVTEATENAVKEGTISEQLRSQIQVGISGTPAEELGTEIYAKVFGAPIDTAQISAKAAAAADSVQESFNPSIVDKVSKQLSFLQERAAAALAPLAKGAQMVTASLPQLAAVKQVLPEGATAGIEKGLANIANQATKNVAPALAKLGPALANPVTLGVGASVAALAYFFTQTERGQEIWKNLSDGAVALYDKVKPALTALGDIVEELVAFLVDDVVGNLQFAGEIVGLFIGTMADGVAALLEFFGLSAKGDEFGDSISSLTQIFNNISTAISGVREGFNALREGVLEIIKKLFDGDITGALSAASELGDKMGNAVNAGMEKKQKELRLEGYQKAVEAGFEIKGNLDKNNRLKELADNYAKTTDAVKKQNIAEVIGKEFGIAADEAGNFAKAQEQALTGQLAGSQKAYINLLKEQGDTFSANKDKADALKKEIVQQAIAGKDVSKLTQEYNKVSEATETSRKALEATVDEGAGLGVTADNLKDIAMQAGLSEAEAAKMAESTKKFSTETKKAKDAARDLAAEWNNAKTNLDNAISGNTSKLSQMAKEGGKNTDEFKKLVAETRESVKQRDKAAKTEEYIQKITGQIKAEMKSLAEQIQLAYDKRAAALDIEQQVFEIAQESLRLQQGRERNAGDELALAQKALYVQEQKRQALIAELTERKAIVKESNGQFTIELRGLKKEDKAKFEADLGQLTRDISASQNAVVDLRLQAKLDDAAFRKEIRAIEREEIQLNIELGFDNTQTLKQSFQQEISVLDEQIAELRKKVTDAAMPSINPETIKQYKRQLMQLIAERQGYEREIDSIDKERKDKALENAKAIADAENAAFDRKLEEHRAKIQLSFELERRIREAQSQKLLDDETKSIDERTDKTLTALQERSDAEIAALDRTKQAGILSQRDYDKEKLTLTKRFEAERLELERQANEERERLTEEARQRQLRLEADAAGKTIILDAEMAKAKIKSLRERIDEAKAVGNFTLASQLSAELSSLQAQLEEKGDIVKQLSTTIGSNIQEGIIGAFAGDDKAFEDSYKKIFGKLAGALKAMLSAFVLEIVLNSPIIKTAIAATGFLAPITTAAFYGAVYGGVNALAGPVIDGLTSFATGGRIDSPTIAVLGDASRLGSGRNTEWVANDDQLAEIVRMSASFVAQPLISEIRALRADLASGVLTTTLRGSDLYVTVKTHEQGVLRRRV